MKSAVVGLGETSTLNLTDLSEDQLFTHNDCTFCSKLCSLSRSSLSEKLFFSLSLQEPGGREEGRDGMGEDKFIRFCTFSAAVCRHLSSFPDGFFKAR